MLPVAGRQDRSKAIHHVAFSSDGNSIVAADRQHRVKIWSYPDTRVLKALLIDENEISSIALSPDSKTLLTSDYGWSICLWDVRTGQRSRCWTDEANLTAMAAFSPDGETLLIGGIIGNAFLRDTRSGNIRQTFAGEEYGESYAIAFSQRGDYVASGYRWGYANIWDAETGMLVRMFENMYNGTMNPVSTLCFSPDGTHILSGSGELLLWNIETGEQAQVFRVDDDNLHPAAFSPDGTYVLSSGELSVAILFETKTGRQVNQFVGHTDMINSLTFSPDGRLVLTGSMDGTARVWDVQTGAELYRLMD